jgi:hypothetical protein
MYLLAFLDDTLPWTYPTAIGFALPCNQATSGTDGSVSSGASQGSPSPDGTVAALAHPTTPAATFTPRTHPHETPLLHITIARISFATFFGVFIPELRVHKSCSDRRLPIGAQPFGLALCMLAEENGGKSNNKKKTKKQKKEEEEKQEERRHLPPNENTHQQTSVSSMICLQQNPEHDRFASKTRKTPQYLPKPHLPAASYLTLPRSRATASHHISHTNLQSPRVLSFRRLLPRNPTALYVTAPHRPSGISGTL